MRFPSRRRRSGFTLIEILVATLLLSVSLMAMMRLWSVSRRMTEKSRNAAEYYVVARQEAERIRAEGYNNVFNESRSSSTAAYTYYNPAANTTTYASQYYDATGALIGTTQMASSVYRAQSSFAMAATSGESGSLRLGIQTITVTSLENPSDTPFTTTAFFTVASP